MLFPVVVGIIIVLLFIKPLAAGAAGALAGLLAAAVCSWILGEVRRSEILRQLRYYGQVRFTASGVDWIRNEVGLRNAVSRYRLVIVPFLIGAAVPAGVVGLIAQGGVFAPDFKMGITLNTESAWGGSLLVAYLGFGIGGLLLLSWWWERRQEALLIDSRVQWGECAGAALPALAELQSEKRALTELGETAGLPLDFPYADTATAIFSGLAQRYVFHGDRELIDMTLALIRRHLDREKLACAEAAALYWETLAAIAEAAALYWETLAAIAEADVVAGQAGLPAAELLMRLGDLKARLFDPHLLELLAAGGTAGENPAGNTAGDYPQIVTATAREAEAIAAEAQHPTDLRPLPAIGEALSMAEAYAVLGIAPGATAAEIVRLRSDLLQVWAGVDAEAAARRQEITAAAAVLLREPRSGPT